MSSGDNDPIKHVVVLMLENRSFDQMLGAFQRKYPELDGIDANGEPRKNVDEGGQVYHQNANAEPIIVFDPHHDLASVLRQIGADPAKPGPDPRKPGWRRTLNAIWNSDPCGWALQLWKARKKKKVVREMMLAPFEGHFVAEYARCYPESSKEQRQQVMSYFDIGSLPALHALAEHFTICDQWFSSLPGPTWANRFFLHTGTTLGTTWMPEKASDIRSSELFDQETLYDQLTAKDRTWKIYFHDFPQSLALSKLWTRESRRRFSVIDDFETDTEGPHSKFPDFVFIEPQYMGEGANDDHPPHDSMLAQELIARVYNSIRANEELWNSTLLVVIYDEHGGFFDHVKPPAVVCPDDFQAEYSFDQLGVRVPAILASPWVKAGVWSEQLDHTSVGKYLCEKWGLKPLGERMAQATSLGGAIRVGEPPRHGVLGKIPAVARHASVPSSKAMVTESPNENQRALAALAEYLDPAQPLRMDAPDVSVRAQMQAPDPNALRRRAMRFIEKP